MRTLPNQGPGAAAHVSGGRCFHECIASQARRTPGNVAIRQGECVVSYAQLDALASQLAHHLRARGAGTETVVGVLLPRSPDLLITLLAVAKSGAAFLPLDPAVSPPHRVAHVLDDADCALAVTVSGLADLAAGPGRAVVRLDTDVAAIVGQPVGGPLSGVRPANLAYIIYTSGSTGHPKGVQVEHGGLANYLLWCRDTYLVPGGGGAPVITSAAFDLGLTALFVPLLGGQQVILAPDDADF